MKSRLFELVLLAAVAVWLSGCASLAPEKAGKAADPLKVAVYADGGPSGIGAVEWWRLVHDSPDMELKLVDGAAVRAGALAGQDLLIMPGGSSIDEFKTLGTNGVEKMKAFIRAGGAYLGTCAGCCLLMDGPQRACVMPWNKLKNGSEGDLFFPNFAVNEAGAKALGIKKGDHRMRYHGGPFMWPTTNVIDGAKFELWGTFNAQACFKGKADPKKAMYGAAGLIGGTYGKGKVFVTSAHPEYFPETQYIVQGAIRWLTGRDVAFRLHQRKPGDLAVGYLAKGANGIKTVKTMLALSDEPGVCLVPVDADGIWEGRLRYVDVLVVPSVISEKAVGMLKGIQAFQARGGKVVTVGRGNANKLKGAVACSSSDDLMEVIR